ncbi:MAG: winged helix-turn-helix transcriptional regulator [Prochlorococcaceae cyanobacterium]|jgi:two-component system phosphate regulon response regulator PhoB
MRLLVLDGQPGWSPSLIDRIAASGLDLICCHQSQEAQQRLQGDPGSSPIDLLVLDLAVAALARSRFVSWVGQQQLNLPVMAVGSRLDEPSRVALLESWADDVMPQPLSVPEFVARCRALLRRQRLRLEQEQQRTPLTRLSHGAIAMVVEEHQVSLGGQPVELTPREFRLLEFLLRHPGQIHSRETLLEQVWGEYSSFELDPKTIDVHVRWLRLKLEADPSAPALITTVRGRGYRFG